MNSEKLKRPIFHFIFFLSLVLLSAEAEAKRKDINYTDPTGPIYRDDFRESIPTPSQKIRIVSYNIKFSEKLASVIKTFKTDPILKNAEVIALQEVVGEPGSPTEHAAHQIAKALHMAYVYAPAIIHSQNGKDFGNAILSRYTLSNSRKLILPHVHFLKKSQRIALGATLDVGALPLDIYSIHAETQQPNRWRTEQGMVPVYDAKELDAKRVITLGDYNTIRWSSRYLLRKAYEKNGYREISKGYGCSFRVWKFCVVQLDHIYAKGIEVEQNDSIQNGGVLRDVKVSDHFPLWFDAKL